MRTFRLLLVPLALLPLGCESGLPPLDTGGSIFTIGSRLRPATLIRPRDYVVGTPVPVVMLLHGYGGHPRAIDRYFGISRQVNHDQFAVILPRGTRNIWGERFWNATDFCCDYGNDDPDDAGYLNNLYEQAGYYVATDGVYVLGFSNGGFMAYRMACESMPGLKGIASLAGSTFHDPNRCAGATPIPVLHLHGTNDSTIWYQGGFRGSEAGDLHYPGARQAVERWAARAGCDVDAAQHLDPIDLVLSLPGEETLPLRYEANCRDGIRLELWTIDGGPHAPDFDSIEFGRRLISWLFSN